MTRHELSVMRLSLGLLVGVLFWVIWQTSGLTSPETESINYRHFLAELPPICIDFFRPWTVGGVSQFFSLDQWSLGLLTFGQRCLRILWLGQQPMTETEMVHSWIGFLPLGCLLGVLFSILKPAARFSVWLLSLLMVAAVVLYCFRIYGYNLPSTSAIIVICCFYLCGSVIFLETEKIERNRNLAIELQQLAEHERKRIAKDLHDESLQSLARIIRLIDKLQDKIPDDPIPQEVRTKLESCIAGTRSIIHDLHPAQLEEFGLAASLEQLLEEFGLASGVKAKFQDLSSATRLSSFAELCIYRIAQEALNNIEKHAEASEVELSLEKTEKFLFLKISDNGKGTVQKRKDSFGLRNMADRATLLSGKVQWTAPDKFPSGTMVVLKVPLLLGKLETATIEDLSKSV